MIYTGNRALARLAGRRAVVYTGGVPRNPAADAAGGPRRSLRLPRAFAPPRRLGLPVALLAGGLAAAACTGDSSGAAEKKKAAVPRAVQVTTAPVEARAVERTVDTTGSLLAREEVVLNTAVPGTVARFRADLGDRVQAGQVVVELDPRELRLGAEQAEAAAAAAEDALRRAQAQAAAAEGQLHQVRESRAVLEAAVNRARAALDEAKVNLERMQRLTEQALVAQRELDVARTQYESALAQFQTAEVELRQHPDRVRVAEAQRDSERSSVRVAEAQRRQRQAELGLATKKLADATLEAPIGGAVARRHVNPGEFVRENTAVLTIVQTDPLKFSGTVAEHAALGIRQGQTVRLRVEPVPGRTFPGRVTRVSPAVDVTSRTVLLEAEVPNAEGLLKPGLFARGAVVLRQDAGVAFVPESAVSYFAGLTRVFVVADGVARERPVTLGPAREGRVEVTEGLRPGEQVATSGLAQLRDGAPVAPQAPARAAKPPAGTR
jgi:RND family efflux transporter MFP subunit